MKQPFEEMPHRSRAEAALPSFNEALLFNEGLELEASLDSPKGLGKSFANFIRRHSFWCNCVEPHDRVAWCRPDTHEKGTMCVNCRGIVSCDGA